MQSTQALLQQFKDTHDKLKSHFSTTVNDIGNNFQFLKNYFHSKLTELYTEKSNLQQALFSAKKNYKVAELSLKEETMKREEELRKREEIIENVNWEQSSMYTNKFLTYKIICTTISCYTCLVYNFKSIQFIELVARCQKAETELTRTTQKLVMSDSQLIQTRQELKTARQDKEYINSVLIFLLLFPLSSV